MRTASAAESKGDYRHKHDLPGEGTHAREIYDILKENAGHVLEFDYPTAGNFYTSIIALRDYYGCDIRRFGKRQWCLVGEWVNNNYIDYVAKRFEQSTVA